jgi:dihydroorotase
VLLRGGRLVDPSQSIDALRDIRIAAGVVVEIGEHLDPLDGEELLDVSGAYVAPGFIDMHVHLRDPGFPEKETIATGTRAAAHGGFAAVACMPNTNPALDTAEVLRELHERLAQEAVVRVVAVGAITEGRKGERHVDFAALRQAGAVAFSDDGNTVMNARVLRDAAIAAADVPGAFISHAEDEAIKGDGVMHEGVVSRALGVPGSPAVAEDVIVARDLLIAAETGKPWHIAHVSTRGALAALAFGRERGARATAEVTPHHLLLTDETVRERGAEGKVNPPLRTQADVRALRDAVREGRIEVFATDHAPHTAAEKSGDLRLAAVGFSGLEVAVGAYAKALPDLPVSRFVALLSTNPARVLGIDGGTLAVGSRGDVTVFADSAWRVDPSRFESKGKATPFAGWEFPRKPLATIVAGRIVYRAV